MTSKPGQPGYDPFAEHDAAFEEYKAEQAAKYPPPSGEQMAALREEWAHRRLDRQERRRSPIELADDVRKDDPYNMRGPHRGREGE